MEKARNRRYKTDCHKFQAQHVATVTVYFLSPGVAGFAGGKACSKLKEHPDTVVPILQASAATGTAMPLI